MMEGIKKTNKNKFGIGIFFYFIIFLSDNFLAAADNIFPVLTIIRLIPILIGFIFYLLTPMTRTYRAFMLWMSWIIVISFITSTLLQAPVLNIIRYISFSFIINYYFKRNQVEKVSNTYFIASILGMLLNILINPTELGLFLDVYDSTGVDFYGRTVWFTGSRNTFGEYFLISTLLFLIAHPKKSKRYKVIFVWTVVALSMTIYVWSATSIVIVILMTIGILLIEHYNVTIMQSIFLSLIISIAVVFFRIQTIFEPIITNYLHRNMTFTGRTYMWDFYIEEIKKVFLVGSGQYHRYIPMFDREYPPHNILLTVFYSYGLIGFIILCSIIFFAIKGKKRYQKDVISRYISLFILLFLIRGVFEASYAAIFIYITIIENIPQIIKEKNKIETLKTINKKRYHI